MHSRWRALGIVIAVSLIILSGSPIVSLGAVTTPAEPTAPSLSVTIDGSTIEEGNTITVGESQVPIQINTSIGPDADINESLKLIVVRVNDLPQQTWEVSNDTANISSGLGLNYGHQPIEVVVKDTNGRLTELNFTIVADTKPPWVVFEQPFTNPSQSLIGNRTLNHSNVTFIGHLDEISGITSFEASISSDQYYGHSTFDGNSLDNHTFRWTANLLPGPNRVHIFTEDTYGHRQLYIFHVIVKDTAGPRANLTVPDIVRSRSLSISGHVVDAVYIRRVQLTVNGYEYTILANETPRKSRMTNRQRFEFSKDVDLLLGTNDIKLQVTDYAGNVHTVSKTVTRKPPKERGYQAPNITISTERTHFVDNDTVRVTGKLSGDNLRFLGLATTTATGRDIDVVVSHGGASKESLTFNETINVSPTKRTKVIVTARDSRKTTRQAVFWVHRPEDAFFTGPTGRNSRETTSPPKTRTASPTSPSTLIPTSISTSSLAQNQTPSASGAPPSSPTPTPTSASTTVTTTAAGNSANPPIMASSGTIPIIGIAIPRFSLPFIGIVTPAKLGKFVVVILAIFVVYKLLFTRW